MKILLLIFLAHVIDDFVLQPQILSNLKQKDYWWKIGLGKGKYKYDYICALLIHSASWSAMISLPLLFLGDLDRSGMLHLEYLFWINFIVHAIVDELKANLKVINLWVDQIIHLVQILILYEICS